LPVRGNAYGHMEEKPELVAIITHILRQEPDLQWLITTPLPVASSQKASIDPKLYQQQVLAAMAAGDYRRKPKPDEVQQRLTAITTHSYKEELDAKRNQSVGDVPTQNIYLSSPRSAENGSHHEGE
jgi:hypothetical protein